MSLKVSPFIQIMDGRAKEAIEYYQEVLNAKVLFMQTIGQGPKDEVSKFEKNQLDLVAHSVLKIGENKIMVADIFPGVPFQKGNQISICITSDDISITKQFYEKLKEDGKILIELNEIYFSPAYGMVTDKFGVTFQIFTARK
ncbi:VOC family protein [Clostridium sp. CM027]|uniref:VOC family protein n=1 Tax=Clostridium sp. CM027 TaxID=2849865 RepID=UPI001C6F16A5|nr:VOC family protein [Clostridium sp. CM027]MBW9146684.1 VOC family protein [Clostridium sp. CM027]UVE41652.1 VOC family protein [Clostridium sp. CM027]